jgi:hypothetical protein
MRRHLVMLAGTVFAFTLAAKAVAQCVTEFPCSEPHEGPGCNDPDCCALVCKFDSHCCNTNWDQECVQLALDICDWVMCGNPGSCTVAHAWPGCEDLACCQWVCPFDAYCCFTAWDEFCVREAERLCPIGACTIDIPANAIDENEPCYERLNDGCNWTGFLMVDVTFPTVRSGKHSSGGPRDTDWYRFTLATRQRVRLELAAEFPGQLVVTNGPCHGPLVVVAESVGLPCDVAVIDTCLEPGTYACLVGSADPWRIYRDPLTCDEIDPDNPPDPKDPPPIPSPYGLRYVLQMEEWPCVLGDLDGDGIVGQTDLALLLGAWGATGVSADLDGDGVVGSPDLAILLGAWSA